jgi:hypothetical protein
VPGEPGELITDVNLTIVSRFGKYTQATGTIIRVGQDRLATPPSTRPLD